MESMWIYARILITGVLILYQTSVEALMDEDYPREAYFNGSTSLKLTSAVSVHRHSALGFSTCEGGRLFKQTYNNNDLITLDVVQDGLVFTAIIDNEKYEAKLNDKFLNNVWHNIRLSFRLGNLTLTAGGHSQIIANATYNSAILTLPDINMSNNTLTIGEGFKGCILQGPGILFNNSSNLGALLGQCPLNNQKCPPCLSNPCKNGGTCLEDEAGEFKCLCQPKFIGYLCETPKVLAHPCANNPCQNNGKCSELAETNYKCDCASGWSGKHCEISTLKCASNPCKNGHCKSSLFNYTCECKTGYEGRNCDINIDECITNPCLNKGTCYDNYGSYFCHCSVGFDGQNCENLLNECSSSPCKNGGSCVDKLGSYHCICPGDFVGKHCEVKKSCETVSCPENSVCIEPNPREPQCVCTRGFIGSPPNCTKSFCANNPCANGGTCSNFSDGYNCTCPPEWKGKNCQVNFDECLSQPCKNGGICTDEINGYTCNCSAPYTGENCEKETDACTQNPCQNNGTCEVITSKSKQDFICNCPIGFEGKICDTKVDDCSRVTCPENRVCVDDSGGFGCKCKDGYKEPNCTLVVDQCTKNPCKNGTCTDLGDKGFHCNCYPGFTGVRCDTDIDECSEYGNATCNTGICVNTVGNYECFCRPGFSGTHCDVDIDECLCGPCKNNATCVDKINSFVCNCPAGYEGTTCESQVDECESNPCQNGAECVDHIAAYSCICTPGFTGGNCETNIDDCESQPCLNSGKCIDGINNYTCNCNDTGFIGDNCDQNINECLSGPCQNNATCIDGVKSYKCVCYPGYTGDNCEIDVPECESAPCQHDGTCLERSHLKNYQRAGQQPNLPAIFSEEFSYANASGYECVCIEGLTGKNCERNINECESSPCLNGECKDKIGGYVCQCDNGFDGDHCENDIDECLSYHPCQHGNCTDGRADYYCSCESKYGGKNCSVELIGCQGNPCQNEGTCYPYLVNETQHKFNCSCPNGFYGATCEFITTLSFRENSYVVVNTTRDEGYDIQFKFRTTLANGALATGIGSTFYILKLVEGKLNLYSSILSKWEGVFIGSGLNNSKWQKVFVAINATHLVLSANEEQTIYPINYNEGSNTSPTFPMTYVGTANSYRQLVSSRTYFIGCVQDIVINGESIYAEMKSDTVQTKYVDAYCPREEQCAPNPCQAGGHCTDKWHEFSCECERPYLGHTCQYNMTAATFSYENITDSFVTVRVSDANRRAVRTIINISMFIRTREPVGDIFYLGTEEDPIYFTNSSSTKSFDNTFIAAQLKNGELLVKMQFNGTEAYTVGGVKLNDGNNHLIQLIRNATLVQVKINGTEYFKKTISASGQLNVTVLYIGGLPSPSTYPGSTTSVPLMNDDDQDSYGEEPSNPRVNFKGVIQDVKITNGAKTMVVEFFPLKADDIPVLFPFGNVSFDHTKVLPGVHSDNVCRFNPCHHNGTCHVTWNDFWCQCIRGYTGKTCQEMEFCQLQDCPSGSKCLNLDSGYECIANATFDGVSTALTYSYRTKTRPIVDDDDFSVDSIVEINYRSNTGGPLMHIESRATDRYSERYFFTVSVLRDNVTVVWKLGTYNQDRISFGKEIPDGKWTKVVIKLNNNFIACGHGHSFDETSARSSYKFNLKDWRELLTNGIVTLGSNTLMRKDSYLSSHPKMPKGYRYLEESNNVNWRLTTMSPVDTSDLIDLGPLNFFKGCLGEVRIGSMLLHFFHFNSVYKSSNFTPAEFMDLQPINNVSDFTGCRLCFDNDCKNGGQCKDKVNSYICTCPLGYRQDDCSENIDECVNHACEHNATCIDGIGNYTCKCPTGWESWACDKDVNECMLNDVCKNDGLCDNLVGSFKCICPQRYTGQHCEQVITCKNNPCKNNATCYDIADEKKDFNCSCLPGFIGDYCEEIYCNVEKCENGGVCLTTDEPMCSCRAGFTGPHCEINIDDCIVMDVHGRNSSPCANDAICIDGNDSYTCDCNGTGYVGFNCTEDVDECQLPKTDCGHGVCVNLNGSYECHCHDGYCGSDCSFEDPCIKFGDICENDGQCQCDDQKGYICLCTPEYTGQNCSEKAGSHLFGSQAMDIAVIVGPIIGILLLAACISLIALFMMARKKRATRGTYSPSAQEFSNPRVEMDNVMKPPPEERLI